MNETQNEKADHLLSCVIYRYIEKNIKMSNCYRKYNREIASFLENCPSYFVNHCLERDNLAENISEEHIWVLDPEIGVFTVQSQTSAKQYQVSFGSKTMSPSCGYYDWERSNIPCKHFFAVFKHRTVWSFHCLPHQYRNSPFFTLDDELVHFKQANSMAQKLWLWGIHFMFVSRCFIK